MKSINVKRIAAVAAGVAMVGSVMASGLAVTQQGEVTSLVSSIKANLDNAQVVVGTHGADISDGVQAAKIAAVLASVNYAAVSTGTVSIKDKQVVLEASLGATEGISSASFPVEMAATTTGTADKYTTSATTPPALTRQTLSSILSQKKLSATVNGVATEYQYEDKIILTGISANYDESTSTQTAGHGLYLNAPDGSLEYRVEFTGGLPVTTGFNYSQIPEIDLLGNVVGLDTATAVNGQIYIYSGKKTSMLPNDEVSTVDNYKVKLLRIYQTSAGSPYTGQFTATSPTGATEDANILSGGSYNFFSNTVSVYVESIGYDPSAAQGIATVRVTGGRKYLQDNSAFPLDTGWTVNHISVVANKLYYISLKYGSITNPPQYTGTWSTGLAQGTVLNGPMKADGTPLYQMQLKGFGSTSQQVATTFLTVSDNLGTSGGGVTPNHLMKAAWTARDGSTQTLDATSPNKVWIPQSGAAFGNLSIGGAQWMIVNDKVLYLAGVDPTGSLGQYNVRFKVGGQNGQDVTVGPFPNASAETLTLQFSTNVNPILCNVTLGNFGMTNDPTHLMINGSGVQNAADNTTSNCDILPNIVPIGRATDMTSSVIPYLDMRYVQGNATQSVGYGSNQPVSLNDSGGTNKNLPLLTLSSDAAGTEKVTFVYDSDNTGADSLTGLLAYRNLALQNSTLGAANYTVNGTSALVNQAVGSGSLTSATQYHTTPFSIEMDASAKDTMSVVVPNMRRNAIFSIASTIGNATGGGMGTYTAIEGQSVGNVKVKTISCTASVTGSNLFSPTKMVQPESLIATDATASASYQIVVGGPWVNSVAQGIAGNALTTGQAGDSYLIADGNKLLVAGFSAADTASAADALVGLLKA